MQEIGALTDAQIDALNITMFQKRKMKALRTACLQGDPTLLWSIMDGKVDFRAKYEEESRIIEEIGDEESEMPRQAAIHTLLSQMKHLS